MIDQQTIGNLIKSFRLAITNLRIYPPTSQMVINTIDTFFKSAKDILVNAPTLTFSQLSGKLLIEGKEPDSREIQLISNDILKLMTLRKVQSITFKKGLSKEEFVDFLTNLITKKRDELPEYKSIALDQTVYVAMVKGEEAVVKISETVNASKGDISSLMKSIRDSYDMMDNIPDPNVKKQLQEHLAQELAKQDPEALREIFDRPLTPRIEGSGLKKLLLNALSREKVQDIFGEISSWYEEIRSKESSDFAAVEKLDKLKNFMLTVLKSPASKEIPRQFFEDLLKKGLLENLPQWFSTEAPKSKTVFDAEKLLDKSSGDLLESDIRDILPELFEKLCKVEYNELLGKLTEKIFENLKSPAAKVRLLTVQLAAKIYDILLSYNKENLLFFTEEPLMQAAKTETSSDVHFYLIELLRIRAKQNLLHSKYDSSSLIIDLIKQHSSEELIENEKMRQNASASFDSLIKECKDILLNDLKSVDENKRNCGFSVLIKFGDKITDILVKIIKESSELRTRHLAAQALKNLGPKAVLAFTNEINLDLTTDELKKMIEVATILGVEETIEKFRVLLSYPDSSIKIEILNVLAKLNVPQSRALIIESLKDTDSNVLLKGINYLGELKIVEAVPKLVSCLSASKLSDEVQEEICVSLGLIEDYRAVPVLLSKLKKRGFLFFKPKNSCEQIRMRAAWALRKFSGPEIEDALQEASMDKSAPVALTAKESLSILSNKSIAKQG